MGDWTDQTTEAVAPLGADSHQPQGGEHRKGAQPPTIGHYRKGRQSLEDWLAVADALLAEADV